MQSAPFVRVCAGLWMAVLTIAAATTVPADNIEPNMTAFDNAAGQVRTFNIKGALDLDNPFFQDLGANGRRCVTCHQPSVAWTITPENVQERFAATSGTDPIFTNNDGSNCEGAVAFSAADRQAAYSLLLTRGLIRVGLDVPAGAQFLIESGDDPYHFQPATTDAALYRPTPA